MSAQAPEKTPSSGSSSAESSSAESSSAESSSAESSSAERIERIRRSGSPDAAGHVGEVIVQVETRARAIELGLVPLGGGVASFRGLWSEARALKGQPGVGAIRWTPPRRLMMEIASEFVQLAPGREEFGVDGSGVVVGVVDTGIDVHHPDFLKVDGSTRIQWLLAYDEPARGKHVALESDFNCASEDAPCAVYDEADINAVLAGATSETVPPDTFGHGSHVASIASGAGSTYPGIAPGADLVIVQGAGRGGAINDARILEGTRFVFDRAAEMGAPAVVNLSLGSGFGAHDGTSLLEQSLEAMVLGPGRAVVVAAGNDGTLYQSQDAGVPAPIGVHTEVTVPRRSKVRISLLELSELPTDEQRAIYVWLSFAPGDDVAIGVRDARTQLTPFVPVGQEFGARSTDLGGQGDYDVFVANAKDSLDLGVGVGNAVVALVGSWPHGQNFELELEGHGTARAWIEGIADQGTDYSMYFARARSGGTVSVPGTSPGLIAVGASVNRESWTDASGEEVEFSLGVPGTRAHFSASGPNQLGQLKPDVLAPGGNVVAAMSADADPRRPGSGSSQFAAHGVCANPDTECFVVDDFHGVSAGTSMAAPVVTGAVALLFQRQPELTQKGIQQLLRVSSAPLSGADDSGRSGAGILDIKALLRAQDAVAQASTAVPGTASRIVLADVFLVPDPALALEGTLVLRDATGLPAIGFEPNRLRLEVLGQADLKLEQAARGLQNFRLAGRHGAGEQTVTVKAYFDDELIAERSLPVFIDAPNANGGLELAGGSCAFGGVAERSSFGVMAWIMALLCARRRRSPLAN